METQAHWENVYSSKKEEELGWFQSEAEASMSLVELCNLPADAKIVDAGSGASVFIDDLLRAGYYNITATDISKAGLEKTKLRLGTKASTVKWVTADLTDPSNAHDIPKADLWHDRAVFHFLTDSEKRSAYLKLLLEKTSPGSFVIIATFALNGAEKCSGLPVCRYDAETLKEFFKNEFALIHSFNHLHFNPRGDERPFVYTLFKRLN
jgi:EEF1A lysine methyltransferase 2